jgi:hypothetical protein
MSLSRSHSWQIYFATMLALLGYLNQGTVPPSSARSEVKIQSVTYAEWARPGHANPVTFERFTSRDCSRFRSVSASVVCAGDNLL